jgi:hypothetical protein
MPRSILCVILVIALTFSVSAKDVPLQVTNWPPTGSTVVRISLGRFKEIGSVAGQHTYVIDTTAESLWNKKISHLGFNLYLFDKNKTRIGDGWIAIDNLSPGQH